MARVNYTSTSIIFVKINNETMSTRSTIIHTKEQEHWFFDSSEVISKPTDIRKDAISIEFSKKNVRVDSIEGEESVCLTITNCESEIYKIFEGLSKLLNGHAPTI